MVKWRNSGIIINQKVTRMVKVGKDRERLGKRQAACKSVNMHVYPSVNRVNHFTETNYGQRAKAWERWKKKQYRN